VDSEDESWELPSSKKPARTNGNFSKKTIRRAKMAAPQDAAGRWCPTCGKSIASGTTAERVIQPSARSNFQRNYQLDHYPDPIAKRNNKFDKTGKWTSSDGTVHKVDMKKLKNGDSAARAAYNAAYNTDVRLQCSTCNLSHGFEGVAGGYTANSAAGNANTGPSSYSTTTENRDSDGELDAQDEVRKQNKARKKKK
jgi:hypothetical protein